MNEIKRGTVGGGFRRGVTGATYSRNREVQPEQQQEPRSEQRTATPPQPPAQPKRPARTNKYGAPCTKCGGYVPAEQGVLDKAGDKWVVTHVQPCPVEQGLAESAKATEAQDAGRNVVNGDVLFDGTYTLETSEGHRTFKLRTQAEDAEFMPGVQLIAYLSGPDNEADYKRFGHIKNGRLFVWKRFQDHSGLVRDAEAFMADPHSALASASCFRCGRTLTVPTSVYAGLGPECSKRGR